MDYLLGVLGIRWKRGIWTSWKEGSEDHVILVQIGIYFVKFIYYLRGNTDEGWKFGKLNFEMDNVSKLKINERSNVERPNGEWQNCEYQISNRRTQTLSNFGYSNWKNSNSLIIFQIVKFWKFVNFQNWKMTKLFNSENSKNFQFWKFQKLIIRKNSKISNLENLQKCSNWRFTKICNLKNYEIFNLENSKISNFENSNNFQLGKF